MTANTYKTTFNGELCIKDSVDNESVIAFSNDVTSVFSGLINVDVRDRIIYINGSFDNTSDQVQELCVKLHQAIVISDDTVVTAQGEDSKDRWDIVFKKDGIYIQEYHFEKGDLKRYTPFR